MHSQLNVLQTKGTPQPKHCSGLDKQERRLLTIAATKKTPLQRRKNAADSFDKLFKLGLIDKSGKITEQGQKVYQLLKVT